jgi:anti-sigma regulatory factor (Ser/Thr protein kinase)
VTSQDVLRFRGTIAGLEQAANELRGLLDARPLAAAPRYNVELVFDEIAGNIVRHGRPGSDVALTVSFYDHEIVLTFDDDGGPFNPSEWPKPVLPTSIGEAPVGGLGLLLVTQLSTRMIYERTPQERNHLTLAIPTV